MAISRSQLVKELEPGLNALFGLEYKRYENQHSPAMGFLHTSGVSRWPLFGARLTGYMDMPIATAFTTGHYNGLSVAGRALGNHSHLSRVYANV